MQGDSELPCVFFNGQVRLKLRYGSGASEESAWEIGSIRKPVGSALLGMAIEDKKLTLDTSVSAVWPEIFSLTGRDKDKAIRVRHLFANSSGWKRPGTKWVYNNSAFTAGGMVLVLCYD